MKTKIKKATDIITIPENFASLEEKSADKFIYRIRYLANPAKASQQNAFKVKIHISKKPYIKKVPTMLSNISVPLLIDKLQKNKAEAKDIARSTYDDYIVTYISDITAKIPNNKANTLKSVKNQTFFSTKRLITKPVSDLKNKNITSPILDANLVIKKPTLITEDESRNFSYELLYNNAIDPALFSLKKSNTIRSSEKAFSGVISKPNLAFNADFFQKSIASTLLNRNSSFNMDELNDDDMLSVLEQVDQNFIEIHEDIEIPISSLVDEDDFYVIFMVVNDKNFPIQISSNLVSHSRYLRLLNVPTKPPTVIGTFINRPGYVFFDIKQEDDNATGVVIYKKIVNTTQYAIASNFVYVGKIELRKSDGIKRVNDVEASLGNVIYRFIPYSNSNDANLGSVFSTVTVKFTKPTNIKSVKRLQRQNFISITGEVQNNGILLKIRDIPPNAISLTIKRRNLSINQKNYEIINSSNILLNLKGDNTLSIEDNNIFPGRIYEYSAFLTYRDGSVVNGSNTCIIEYSPIVSNIVNTTISQPRLISNDNGYDVVFDIELKILNNEAELIKKLISEQGLQSEFQNDIVTNKEKLARLFAIQVIRDNLISGEREYFGIIDSLNFSDRKYGIPKNVKSIDPGAIYEYTVTTYFRNPETLFPKLYRNINVTSNYSYLLKPFKWHHPVTLRSGNIVTEASLKCHYPKDNFEHGIVADIQKVNISLANVMPVIENAKATRVREKANLIQWTINGNPLKIDHYILILEMLGMRTIVGASHSISNSNYFEFLDVLDNQEKGAITYIIVPVYYDYSKGVETKTNTIII